MLQSSLVIFEEIEKRFEEIGFKVNPYDPCVANRIVGGQ
jgi:hypothetical protein